MYRSSHMYLIADKVDHRPHNFLFPGLDGDHQRRLVSNIESVQHLRPLHRVQRWWGAREKRDTETLNGGNTCKTP